MIRKEIKSKLNQILKIYQEENNKLKKRKKNNLKMISK